MEVLEDDNYSIARIDLGRKAVKEYIGHPFPVTSEELEARGVEELEREVSLEEAPNGTVSDRADVVLVASEEEVVGQRGRAVDEDSALLEEGLVGEAAIHNEDGGPRANAEGDYGVVPLSQLLEEQLDIEEGSLQRYGVSDDREGGRAWRNLCMLLLRG